MSENQLAQPFTVFKLSWLIELNWHLFTSASCLTLQGIFLNFQEHFSSIYWYSTLAFLKNSSSQQTACACVKAYTRNIVEQTHIRSDVSSCHWVVKVCLMSIISQYHFSFGAKYPLEHYHIQFERRINLKNPLHSQ